MSEKIELPTETKEQLEFLFKQFTAKRCAHEWTGQAPNPNSFVWSTYCINCGKLKD